MARPDSVGQTPLLELDVDLEPTVYAKAEWFNQPAASYGGGSVKTRIGKSMIDAVRAAPDFGGDLTLLEASSGNTGTPDRPRPPREA